MRFALILSLIIAVLAVVFAVYNPQQVEIRFPGAQVAAPLAIVIIVTLMAGVLAGILASLPGAFRRGRRIKTLEKRLEDGGHTPPPAEAAPARSARQGAQTEVSGGAEETQRLAAETQRMATEAQRRAAQHPDPEEHGGR